MQFDDNEAILCLFNFTTYKEWKESDDAVDCRGMSEEERAVDDPPVWCKYFNENLKELDGEWVSRA